MSAKRLTHQGLTSRVYATGVPRGICSRILDLFNMWNKCSGSEWTVSRIKSVKLDVLRKKAGLPPVSSWVARSHRKLLFSGAFGSLECWMFKHPNNFQKGVQLLQIYTSLISASVTAKQKHKFVSAVTSQPPNCEALAKYHAIVDKGRQIAGLSRRVVSWRFQRIIDMPASSEKRGPIVGNRTLPERQSVMESILFLIRTRGSFMHYLKYRFFYDQVLNELSPLLHKYVESDTCQRHLGDEWTGKTIPQLVVGQIGLIQEPGYKLRAVANPGRVFQAVLKPLQRFLLHLVNTLPWDCTHDQTLGIPKIQKALSQGRMVHSIDLSNATDFFPLSLQTGLLRSILCDGRNPSLVDLFDEISKSEWWMPGYGYIQWQRGQPLGLNPSFPSFALTHGLLLLGLLDRKYDDDFFVLGDDVVILDSTLKTKYLEALHELGCPVSMEKSLSSNSLAEFGGKLISKDAVIPQYKYRVVSDDSFIDIARIVGLKGLRLFNTRQKRVIKNISGVPEFLGGFGWNPKGLPLEDRLKTWCFDDSYKPNPRVTSLSNERIHRMMNSSIVQTVVEMDRKVCLPISYPMPSDDLEQRSIDLLTKYCPVLRNWPRISGENLDWVFHSLDKELDLPVRVADGESVTSRRKATTLTRWEKKLGTPVSKAE